MGWGRRIRSSCYWCRRWSRCCCWLCLAAGRRAVHALEHWRAAFPPRRPQVLGDGGQLREDAAVNSGNALCAVAELLTEPDGPGGSGGGGGGAGGAARAYEEAHSMYQVALAQVRTLGMRDAELCRMELYLDPVIDP
eukprot:355526-Chlamydomonas_euryale.AAC.4